MDLCDLRTERDLIDAPAPGIHPDATMAQYLAWKAASASLVKDVLDRGVGYADRARRIVKEDTPATERGTAIHSAILEPHDFEIRYAALSIDHDGRTQGGKAEKAAIVASGRKAIKAQVWEACVRLREKAWANPTLAALLEQAETEVSATWYAPVGDILAKARADVLARDARMILDFKSTEDASAWAFGKTAAEYGYHVSAPWYIDGFTAAGVPIDSWTLCALECAETVGHYSVRLYTLDPLVLTRARARIETALRAWSLALSTGQYDDAPAGFVPLPLPKWTFDKE